MLLLLAACPLGDKVQETGTPPRDTRPDSPVETAEDPVDTAIAQGFIYNQFAPSGPVQAGLVFLKYAELPKVEPLCTIVGNAYELSAPACEVCDFAFELRVTGSGATGSGCRDVGWDGRSMDGYTARWGFAAVWEPYYPGDGYLHYENVVFYSGGESWLPLTFYYDGAQVGGYTATSGEVVRAWTALQYFVYYSP